MVFVVWVGIGPFAGVLALTLHSMREHAGQALVQEYGCGTLWNLMLANAEIKPTIAQADGVALVLECMRAHPKNPGVQLNGAAACKEFVTHPKTLEPMKRLGARKLLEGVMEAHPYNADLLKLIATMKNAKVLLTDDEMAAARVRAMQAVLKAYLSDSPQLVDAPFPDGFDSLDDDDDDDDDTAGDAAPGDEYPTNGPDRTARSACCANLEWSPMP